MRRTTLTLALSWMATLAGFTTAWADFPRQIHYQGVITDSTGTPITDSGVSVRYLLYDVPAGGAFFWAEVTSVDVTQGKVNHYLGSLVPLPDSIFTALDSLWLEILVQGEALSPRILLTPAPYSMRVATIDQAKGGDVYGDVTIHSTLQLGDQFGDDARILVYDGLGARIVLDANELAGEPGIISMTNTNSQRAIDLDAGDTQDIAHVRMYHEGDHTLDLAASVNDTLGSQIRMFTLSGGKTIEIDAEYPGGDRTGGGSREGRIGVNADPDSGAIHAHSANRYTGFFTNSYNSSYPVALKAQFLGGSVLDPIAVWGESWPSDGKGSGGFFRGGEHGVRAIAEGGNATHGVSALQGFAYGDNDSGDRYGVYGVAEGGKVAYGVYGFASQGGANWSSYFAGANFMSRLAIGTDFVAATNTNAPPPTGYLLAVNGKMLCEEVEVMLSEDWPDYVFKDDYDLMSLAEVEARIKADGHLPGVPRATEVAEKGVALGAISATLLEKVEEMTLHLIALNKSLEEVRQENENLRLRLAALEGGE